MRLVIAEKPALGNIIGTALGVVSKKNGYIECKNNVLVTWCIGHVLEYMKPDEINLRYKSWNKEDLPLKVRPLKLKPKISTITQFKVIETLIKKANLIVNAGDPDDEGELLIREVLDYVGYKGELRRVLINDLNVSSVQKAFKSLKDGYSFTPIYHKALARSQADYLYGMNLTRAYTISARNKGINDIYSVGRVQTPTLGLIVKRYLQNKSHKDLYYYNLVGDFDFGNSSFQADFVNTDSSLCDEKGRIIDEKIASKIVFATRGKEAVITGYKVEDKKTQAPLPYALLDLQAQMNELYGINASETLDLTQSLREKHKAITYNRSDCRYLTNEQFEDRHKTIDFLKKLFSYGFSDVDLAKKSPCFNDEKVTAHTAIIPVISNFNLSDLSDKERKLYNLIAKRYLMQFYPEKEYRQINVDITVGDYTFKKSVRKTTKQGFELLSKGSTDEQINPLFDTLLSIETKEGKCIDCIINKAKTKPLPMYTDATLLKDLRSIAKYVYSPRIKELLLAKDKGIESESGGIGTPATRSAIIKNLNEKGYFVYEGKKIVPTPKGIDFINALPPDVTLPDMTALWFEQQQKIESGEISVNQFLDDLEEFIKEQVALSHNVKLAIRGVMCDCGDGVMVLRKGSYGDFYSCSNYPTCRISKGALNGKPAPNCPCCDGALQVNKKAVSCQKDCGFILWRNVAGKDLSDVNLVDLIVKGKTKVIKGFKSKQGKDFNARILFDKATMKTSFEFIGDKK